MTRYLWHFNADVWPLERIDTRTGEHVPVFIGGPEESLHRGEGGRPSWPAPFRRSRGWSGSSVVTTIHGKPGTCSGEFLRGAPDKTAQKEVG